jgi:hypothetical protein
MPKRKPAATPIKETAYHEAGHAVALHHCGIKYNYVTIEPDEEGRLGHVLHRLPKWFNPETDLCDRVRLLAERHIIVNYAGQIAQTKFRGKPLRFGMESDNATAIDLAIYLCGGLGATCDAYLLYCLYASLDVVNLRWREIEAVAEALLARKTLKYDDVLEIIWPGSAAFRERLEASNRRTKQRGAG